MTPHPLDYASVLMVNRHPRWAGQVPCFAGVAFAVGLTLNFVYCRYRKVSFGEVSAPFENLCVLLMILTGYAFFSMGSAAFFRTRRPYVAIKQTWFIVLAAAVAYGAIPAATAASSDFFGVEVPGWAFMVAVGLTPILLPVLLLRRSAS